ncbi:MAG: hypothetical protein BEN19_07835 [Epulopiscium sp. Nuni2H_MBin003]|nr:MAG: hypothetical protein BEN19_07835 [Epulopiscium sp. Nuni2H_MBin003]
MTSLRIKYFYSIITILFIISFILSIFVGKYPLSIEKILAGDAMQLNVFFNLRLSRTLMAFLAGFTLSLSGYVYQTIFRNPIASPDIIGVSSGASLGVAIGIVFLSGSTIAVISSAFIGAMSAVIFTIAVANMTNKENITSFVISGVAINSLTSSALMLIKYVADPEGELARIEYFTMGSFASVTMDKIFYSLPIVVIICIIIFKMFRLITLLSLDYDEAKMLGIPVKQARNSILFLLTIAMAIIISITGRISFIGLISPHVVRLVNKTYSVTSMFFSSLLGATILLFSDCLARSLGESEIPISVLTSFIGAPLLIFLVIRGDRKC